MQWGRLLAARWLAAAVMVAVLEFLLLAAGVTVGALRAAAGPLSRAADQATVLGGALAVAGLACSAGRAGLAAAAGQHSPRARPGPAPRSGRVPGAGSQESAAGRAGPGQPLLRHPGGPGRPAGLPGPLSSLQRAVGGLLRYTPTSAPAGSGPTHGGPCDLQSVGDYFARLENGRLVVLGRPGSGKTVLAIELVLQLLRGHVEDPAAAAGRIPVRPTTCRRGTPPTPGCSPHGRRS